MEKNTLRQPTTQKDPDADQDLDPTRMSDIEINDHINLLQRQALLV